MTIGSRFSRPVRWLPLIATLVACGSSGSAGGIEAGGTNSGGGSGAGGIDSSHSGGTTGDGGATDATGGADGTQGGGGSSVKCSNSDPKTLPIDASGRVERACNAWDIQGGWYCFDDNINPTSCIDGKIPYRASAAGMCLSGYTTIDPTFAAYGATIGLSLNSEVGAKLAYDAAANGVTGIQIQVTGNTGGNPLHVMFTGSANPGMSPYVEVKGTGSFEIPIAEARVPETWSGPEAGQMADPSNIWDIRFQILGGLNAANYDFCITRVTPLTAASGGAGGTGGP
ncbi:MAG TPA: hypothetical protein VG937_34275 [Polyangiaceae bacterium]|nr:hypothetical protein [Polyangiaceae bacterium]